MSNGVNLKNFLYPKSVAIIGASKDPKKIGFQILHNVLKNKFRGDVYPINLKEQEIAGLKAYGDIASVPKKGGLAVICIPAEFVAEEVRNCALAGFKDIIIISAGFSEDGGVGRMRELKIKELAKKYKLNVLGPNCLGLINTACNLNATFASARNKEGNVAFLSQSGAICAAVLDWAADKNLGFSKFISIGNQAVLNENDFFEYFIDDKNTDLVVAYLEEIEEGKKFMDRVSKLAKVKPVAILKSGKTQAGATAALSHTGSLAGSSQAVSAGIRRAGAIELDNIEQMFNLIKFYSRKRKLNQPKLALVSNAGGPLVSTVDLLAQKGLELASFSKELASKLELALPPIIKVKNPLDLIGDAPAERYRKALDAILEDGSFQILLVLLTPQTATQVDETALMISELARRHKDKVILTSFIGGREADKGKYIIGNGDALDFDFPNQAVDVIAKVLDYESARTGLTTYRAKKSKENEIRFKNKQLDYIFSLKLLEKSGIDVLKATKIKDHEDLEKLDYPVAMKVVGKDLIHKTEEKAIFVNIGKLAQAQHAMTHFKPLLKHEGNYAIAQTMGKGLEMIVGVKNDPSFGPIILAGMGGIYAEVFKDVQTEIGDLDAKKALEMLKKLKIYPILKGTRGQDGYDIKSVADVLVKLSKLANEHTNIKELDINPLFVTKKGSFAADVRIIT